MPKLALISDFPQHDLSTIRQYSADVYCCAAKLLTYAAVAGFC